MDQSATRRSAHHSTGGFSVVEVLLASSIFAAVVATLVGAIIYGQETARTSAERTRAVWLAEEALEAARNIRDDDFANIVDGTHGLAVSGGQWTLSGSSDAVDIFTRTLTVGTVDADTKSAIAQVTWQQTPQRSGSVSLETRLTNWLATGGGEVGDWSNPQTEGTYNASGNQNGTKVQISGDYAYVVRNGGTPDFLVIDISDTANPSLAGSLTLAGNPANIAVSGNYAYVVGSQNNQEFQVIDISTPTSPSQVGSLNFSGNTDAVGVYAVGTTVYVTRESSSQPEFYVINTTIPTVPVTLGSLEIGSDSNEVFVLGTHAYLATDDNSSELVVVDVSVPALPSSAGTLNLAGNSNAETIIGYTDRMVLGRADGTLHLVDVSTPASPSEVSTFDAGSQINDVDVGNSNTYVFLATGNNTEEFQVVDITTEGSPSLLGSLDASGDLNGLDYDSSIDRVVAVGDDNSEEVIIIAPQ